MNKKNILLTFAISTFLLMSLNLSGCSLLQVLQEPMPAVSDETAYESNSESNSFLEPIPGKENLYYYSTTHIVYIWDGNLDGFYSNYACIAPYYSKNGKLCTYDPETSKLTELNN